MWLWNGIGILRGAHTILRRHAERNGERHFGIQQIVPQDLDALSGPEHRHIGLFRLDGQLTTFRHAILRKIEDSFQIVHLPFGDGGAA